MLAAQLFGLIGASWMVCAEWAPLAAHDQPIVLLGKAFLYLILAWAGAFAMVLWTYMVISLDEFRELRWAAMRAALHALWFVPAMLLISPAADPWVIAAGLVLMVNAAAGGLQPASAAPDAFAA